MHFYSLIELGGKKGQNFAQLKWQKVVQGLYCVEQTGGRAFSHQRVQQKLWFTPPVRWGWHAQNRIRSDHILHSHLSLSHLTALIHCV